MLFLTLKWQLTKNHLTQSADSLVTCKINIYRNRLYPYLYVAIDIGGK